LSLEEVAERDWAYAWITTIPPIKAHAVTTIEMQIATNDRGFGMFDMSSSVE
jgi:hypothetical protein